MAEITAEEARKLEENFDFSDFEPLSEAQREHLRRNSCVDCEMWPKKSNKS